MQAKQWGRGATCLLAAAILAVSTGLPDPAAAENLRFACNPFPPHKIEGAAAGREGFDIDILRAVLAGDSVEIVFYPWRRALALAEAGTVDGLCSCSHMPEREQAFVFSTEIGNASVGLFALPDDRPLPSDGHALQGQTIGAVAGYNLTSELREFGAIPAEAPDDATAVAMLKAGRFAYLYGYRDTVRWFAGTQDNLRYTELRPNPYYTCFSRKAGDATARAARFDAAFRRLEQDGTIAAIRARYGAGGS
jgi:polar amino acid transport system substrate-binding protein